LSLCKQIQTWTKRLARKKPLLILWQLSDKEKGFSSSSLPLQANKPEELFLAITFLTGLLFATMTGANANKCRHG
jgi:hypothetical protein